MLMDAIQKASQTWGDKRNPGALNGKTKKTKKQKNKKKKIKITIYISIQLVTLIA